MIIKKKFLLFCLVLHFFSTPFSFASKKVTLRVLDKITGHVFLLNALLNEEITFRSLRFKVEKAAKNPPEERPEVYAYITIWDTFKTDENNEPKKIFKNWMFSSSPALSALDHPLYDLWVVDYNDVKQEPLNSLPVKDSSSGTLSTK